VAASAPCGARTGPMRQKDLAASLSLDGSSVVRLLDALQIAGLKMDVNRAAPLPACVCDQAWKTISQLQPQDG
jgi:hypothetical protein